MSKAERRKRARQRAKDKERAQAAAAPAPVSAAPVITEAPSSEPVSDYITGPIAPVVQPAPRRQAVRLDLPTKLIEEPLEDDEDEDEDEDDDVDAPEAENGEDDEDEEGEESDDSDDDDDDDDEEGTDEEEALFNVACAAIESGDGLTWNELINWLCSAEIEDPRLALVVALLVDQDERGRPVALTGNRVLKVLEDLRLGDLVEEAREVAGLVPPDAGDSPEDRAIVRTNARELSELAKVELADGKPKKKTGKPVKASQLKERQTALGTVLPVTGRGNV